MDENCKLHQDKINASVSDEEEFYIQNECRSWFITFFFFLNIVRK